MRIVQVVHSFYPAIGGIEQHVYHLSKELVKQGHEVIVHTTGKGKEGIDGVTVKYHWALSLPFFSSVNLSPGLVLSLLRERADVFASHGYGSTMPYWTALVAWLKGKPFVFTLHGYPRLRGVEGIFQWFYKIFIASIFLRIAKKIIIVSRATERDIEKEADARKIVYIPNGVSGVFFQIKKQKSNAIAYIGRFDRYKRIDMLIEAFAEVKKEFPELELTLIGRDEGIRAELEAAAKRAGVEVLFGEAKPDDMPQLYSQLKAVVLPSAYEGFSLVWLEAIASQRVVFSTPVGEAPELFANAYGKDADKFLFRDTQELVSKLRGFLENEKAYEKTVAAARATVKTGYSWKTVAERTLKTYRGLLD